MEKKTYLVTGGSGFIGSHLVETLLKNGHFVINVDNFDDFYDYKIKIKNTLESVGVTINFDFENKNLDIIKLASLVNKGNYRFYYQDIRDKEGLEKIFKNHRPDVVVHLAALAGVRPSIESPLEYQEVNIKGTMNLWEVAKDLDVCKFVIASSSSVYGNNEKIPFSEEDNVDRPISPYAATKKCVEILGHTYHHLYGMDMVQLRFFTVYGPRQRPDLAIHKFAKIIKENELVPFYGDGNTARDYTFIDDIIDGIIKSIKYVEDNTGVYEIFNLGESEVVSLHKMLSTIEEELGVKATLNKLPMQAGDVQKTNADIRKAQQKIGYAPTTNFQNGIKKFVEWFLRK
ncbi:GDP-mannose 4,6-dehydratase [Riemerella anatipestifer]|uniref:GDP-mannose 4,6-dehydratase n=1 Tax=Riemerella anatipestifer TaxID=34085 RepID=A0AAP3EVJ5_RIEAN|nr:GDP-mannose 4,6-dehydratase [Riemerella anatipestifer]MBT0548824.1 GDP-mannose 4,6-dehydratase [Riemerella anatipestifer]MBT0555137.1 GDP-mannose 4,6-dehydratase [Riemerella anatipestifer]MBT0559587.1 GDP-mannose 4,6-dehydratase [Riemerella anatipestifer]MBT0572974.1 GDP-mannose 4,6-dehydratase [Riemerella anatipestifer]MCD5968111.1 GDP-mannose 4,6-dehydratase [Riemerella anatipestifer]